MDCFTVTDSKRNDIIPLLSKQLTPICQSLCGNVERGEYTDREYIVFEVPKVYSKFFKDDYLSTIAKYTVYLSKLRFYKEHIPFYDSDNLYSFILLKTLIYSDIKLTQDKLQNAIENFEEICIDGIYNFILKDDKREWREVAEITKDNARIITHKSEYKRFLKCITSTIENRHEVVYLMDGEPNNLLSEDMKKIAYSYSEHENLPSDFELLAALIENYPKKLVIYAKNMSDTLSEGLDLLFDTVRKKMP